ncbi:hypothetical protein NDU88_004936 [Pleurodeles waltl]|uniref:Uncharacterized protein n=1 Tax=Pleurodeles waltl TaxID=8319 RepID=A0AAV7WTC3_PLEWA|nr:hypothetical protein NDU88_004936 [Pleurodeles waltl]
MRYFLGAKQQLLVNLVKVLNYLSRAADLLALESCLQYFSPRCCVSHARDAGRQQCLESWNSRGCDNSLQSELSINGRFHSESANPCVNLASRKVIDKQHNVESVPKQEENGPQILTPNPQSLIKALPEPRAKRQREEQEKDRDA